MRLQVTLGACAKYTFGGRAEGRRLCKSQIDVGWGGVQIERRLCGWRRDAVAGICGGCEKCYRTKQRSFGKFVGLRLGGWTTGVVRALEERWLRGRGVLIVHSSFFLRAKKKDYFCGLFDARPPSLLISHWVL